MNRRGRSLFCWSWDHSWKDALLVDDVALVVEGDMDRLTVLHRRAAPDRLRVLLPTADIAVAMRLEAAAGLGLGEAIGAGDRRRGRLRIGVAGGDRRRSRGSRRHRDAGRRERDRRRDG